MVPVPIGANKRKVSDSDEINTSQKRFKDSTEEIPLASIAVASILLEKSWQDYLDQTRRPVCIVLMNTFSEIFLSLLKFCRSSGIDVPIGSTVKKERLFDYLNAVQTYFENKFPRRQFGFLAAFARYRNLIAHSSTDLELKEKLTDLGERIDLSHYVNLVLKVFILLGNVEGANKFYDFALKDLPVVIPNEAKNNFLVRTCAEHQQEVDALLEL